MSRIILFDLESHAQRFKLDAAGRPSINIIGVGQVLKLLSLLPAFKIHLDGNDLQKMEITHKLGRMQRAHPAVIDQMKEVA